MCVCVPGIRKELSVCQNDDVIAEGSTSGGFASTPPGFAVPSAGIALITPGVPFGTQFEG